jgi:hypothetical protein
VYLFFPEIGLLAFGPGGEEQWRVPLGPFRSIYGMCTSPIVADDKVILVADQTEGSFIAAFSKKYGEVMWRRERSDGSGGYSTPIIVKPEDDASQVIVSGSGELAAYSVEDGRKLWWVGGMPPSSFSAPIANGSMIYAAIAGVPIAVTFESLDENSDGQFSPEEAPPHLRTAVAAWGRSMGDKDGLINKAEFRFVASRLGGDRGKVVAVRHGGRGEVAETNLRWTQFKGFPLVPTPLLYGGSALPTEQWRDYDGVRCHDGRGYKANTFPGSHRRLLLFSCCRARKDLRS